ncbi:MAG: SDR family NAD(P)-dependent oxidoreductase [Bacteroidia bacterium]
MNQQTILITGATSGIGEACAKLFALPGNKLILTGRRKDRLEKLSKVLELHGAKIYFSAFDVRNKSDVEAFVDEIPADFRNIRVLINNAGLAAGLDPIQSGNTDDWDRMIDTNVKGLLYMSRSVLPLMKLVENAHIVNIGSIAGKEVYPSGNVYSGTKHAVDALTRSMRIDLMPLKIRVSSVSPGLVETEFSEVRFAGDTEKAKAVYKGFEPLRAEDIAGAVEYILQSPSHVNIADIVILAAAQASSRDVNRGA